MNRHQRRAGIAIERTATRDRPTDRHRKKVPGLLQPQVPPMSPFPAEPTTDREVGWLARLANDPTESRRETGGDCRGF
jgi:hypothetical protein